MSVSQPRIIAQCNTQPEGKPGLQAFSSPVAPQRTPLGTILLRNGSMTAPDLMRALEIQTHQQARLGDILRAHGLASESAVIAALAEQFDTSVIDTTTTRPDPRLIDLLGPRRCLQMGCLPWARAGSCTLIASSSPDRFADHRAELEAALGPVTYGVISETDLHQALIGSRQSTLRLMAETCVKASESCRNWDGPRFSRMMAAAVATLLAAIVLAPLASFLALFGLVVLALILGSAMKIASAVIQLRSPKRIPDNTLRFPTRKPPVSIMVPMFREPNIAPRLVKRLGALDYPRELLDVMLVVEEDDTLTRDALARSALPHWMRVIPVPDSTLRTKPRALNYALNFARGSIVGVYDAEDAPAPDQIHRIVDHFA